MASSARSSSSSTGSTVSSPPSEKTGGVFATEQRAYRRERVTRCRHCAHASPCPLADSEKLMCAFHDEMLVNPGDFCAWGVPREEA